jgi:hypothetical protein
MELANINQIDCVASSARYLDVKDKFWTKNPSNFEFEERIVRLYRDLA